MPSLIKSLKYTEVLITIALVAILSVVAIPAIGGFRDQRHAQHMVDLAKELSDACVNFQKDVGRYALELTPSQDGNSYVHPRFHQLSMAQGIRGWRGPYLDRPLSRDMNPFGQAIYVQNNLAAAPAHGFNLQGLADGISDGDGQFVVFHGVPERIAKKVDDMLDGKSGKSRIWRERGRVEWAPGGGGSLSICLLDGKRK